MVTVEEIMREGEENNYKFAEPSCEAGAVGDNEVLQSFMAAKDRRMLYTV